MSTTKMGKKVRVDNDVLKVAAIISLMHYCYRWSGCTPKCKVFSLCQQRFCDAGEYGEFEKWGLPFLLKGMETVGGTVAVKSGRYETTITSTEATERTVK